MRKTVLAVGLLISAVALTGCFNFVSSHYSSYSLKVGKTTTATIDARAMRPTGPKMYPLILVGVPADGSARPTGAPKFDAQGNFGGPFKMVRDNDIRDAL